VTQDAAARLLRHHLLVLDLQQLHGRHAWCCCRALPQPVAGLLLLQQGLTAGDL
jgi:hypothetical protein